MFEKCPSVYPPLGRPLCVQSTAPGQVPTCEFLGLTMGGTIAGLASCLGHGGKGLKAGLLLSFGPVVLISWQLSSLQLC